MTFLPALLVLLLGLFVLGGHVLGWSTITHLNSEWVDMKIQTAIGFILAGGTLGAMAAGLRIAPERWPLAAKTLGVALLALLQSWILTHQMTPSPTAGTEAYTAGHGLGSNATTIGFVLFGVGALVKGRGTVRAACGLGLVFLGLLAVVGYVGGWPSLYYYAEGASTAMALHTALAFMLLGLGMLAVWYAWFKRSPEGT